MWLSQRWKEYRKNRVFINWSQNDASKTMVCVYSLRAGPAPALMRFWGWQVLPAPALSPVLVAAVLIPVFGGVYLGLTALAGVSQLQTVFSRLRRQ